MNLVIILQFIESIAYEVVSKPIEILYQLHNLMKTIVMYQVTPFRLFNFEAWALHKHYCTIHPMVSVFNNIILYIYMPDSHKRMHY